jgi:RND family efflux transporter MFP subunit
MRPITNIPNLVRACAAGGLLAVTTVLTGCGSGAHSQELSLADASQQRIPVMTETAHAGTVRAFVRGNAVLEAREQADVVAEATGVVTEILVEEGDTVERGQLLARLDNERAQLELTRAKAQLEQLRSASQRQQEMVRRHMVSQETLEQFEADYQMQKSAMALAELMVEKANIRAPFDGVVTARQIKLGQQIANNQTTFSIADFSSLEAVMNVAERNSAQVVPGQVVNMNFLALPDDQFEGHIARVSPVVNADSGTVRVTVRLDNPSGIMRPGMLAQLSVQLEQHEAPALVSSEAIVIEDEGLAVFVVNDGVASKVLVQTGLIEGMQTEIVDGLAEGDVVVTAGQNRLNEGDAVSVVAGP